MCTRTPPAPRLDFRNLPGGGQLTTYSETGQLVSQALLAENAGRVALPALRAGLYCVMLRDAAGRKVATERLVVSGRYRRLPFGRKGRCVEYLIYLPKQPRSLSWRGCWREGIV